VGEELKEGRKCDVQIVDLDCLFPFNCTISPKCLTKISHKGLMTIFRM